MKIRSGSNKDGYPASLDDPAGILSAIEAIDRAIRVSPDIDHILDTLIDEVFRIFRCDRAWLLYPCNPSVEFFNVPHETTTPGYPGAKSLGGKKPMTDYMAGYCRTVLASDGQPCVEPPTGEEITNPMGKEYGVRSMLYMAIVPRIGDSWVFGLHQCDHTRVWTEGERRLFRIIGERITDSLNTLLYLRKLKESRSRLETAGRAAYDLIYEWDVRTDTLEWFGDIDSILGFEKGEISRDIGAWLDLIHPDDIGVLSGAVELHRTSVEPILYEYRIRHKDGTYSNWKDKALPLLDADGTPYRWVGVCTDITEIRNAERALTTSREKYRSLTEEISDWVWEVDERGVYTYASPRVRDLLGYEPEELIGRTPFDLMPEGEAERVREIFGEYFAGKKAFVRLENGNLTKDGREVYLESSGTPIFDEDGQLAGYRGIDRDITETKVAVEALKLSEERFDLAMRFANDGLFDWDLLRNEIYFSPGWKRILGYEDHEIKNDFSEWARLTEPGDVEASWKILNEVISGEREKFEAEFRMLHKDGHWVDILSRANVVFNSDGLATRVLGTHVDISERKRAEEEILRQKKKAERLLRIAGVMFIGLDAEGKIDVVNRRAAQNMGYEESEMIGMDWFDNFLPERVRADVRFTFTQLIEGKIEPFEYYENSVLTKTGEEKMIAWHNALIKDDEGRIVGVISSGEDVTTRKQLEEQISQSQKLEAISTLAGGIAHDFNNMLGVIIGNASLALSYYDRDDDLYEILSDVQEGARKAQTLTQQLLTFSRGGQPVKKVADLNHLLEESATFVSRGAKARCDFSLDPDLWPVEIDNGQINQVVNNLIINSIQAMPEGGVIRIRTSNVELDANSGLPLKPGPYVSAEFTDEGTGIAEKHIPNIFDPFFTTKQMGNGLGLATTYSIIKRHGGHISVESELGTGTSFNVYLPAVEGEADCVDESPEKEHRGQGRILVMDDQESILKMLGRLLEQMGYESVLVKDGKEAIDVYREACESGPGFDLVILDLTVPGGLGGAKTIPELLKIDPEVLAIVSSGYSNDPVMANYRDYGFAGVVPKPYTKVMMAGVLSKLLGETP